MDTVYLITSHIGSKRIKWTLSFEDGFTLLAQNEDPKDAGSFESKPYPVDIMNINYDVDPSSVHHIRSLLQSMNELDSSGVPL